MVEVELYLQEPTNQNILCGIVITWVVVMKETVGLFCVRDDQAVMAETVIIPKY